MLAQCLVGKRGKKSEARRWYVRSQKEEVIPPLFLSPSSGSLLPQRRPAHGSAAEFHEVVVQLDGATRKRSVVLARVQEVFGLGTLNGGVCSGKRAAAGADS